MNVFDLNLVSNSSRKLRFVFNFYIYIFRKGLRFTYQIQNSFRYYVHKYIRMYIIHQVIYDILFCQILLLCNEEKIGKNV